MNTILLLFVQISVLVVTSLLAGGQETSESTASRIDRLQSAKRIVFLGDSITYAGSYISMFESWMVTHGVSPETVIINLGLPSETVSGLSEQGHADDRFPRPDLADRLDRALQVSNPDLVIACYGINCGIYQPLDPDRTVAFQSGIRRLQKKVEQFGAHLILMTSPTFDDRRSNPEFSYDAVLCEYANWLIEQKGPACQVIDLHTAMRKELDHRRKSDPGFTFQPDAVHPNQQGHWFIASHLIRWFGDPASADHPSAHQMLKAAGADPQILVTVRQRSELLRDAYLTAVGHKRPGIRVGLPVDQAKKQALDLTELLIRQIKR